jgi:branched-chain amino acid transport system substrate-binding protein
MKRSRSSIWLAFMLVLSLGAAACGGGTKSSTSKSPAAAGCNSGDLKVAAAGTEASYRLAEATPQATGGAKKTLVIGAFGDRTGGNSQIIIPSHNAEKLAIDQANAKGDLPVTLSYDPRDNKDAASNVNGAIPLAQQFIANPNVVGVLGGGFSGETGAVGNLFSNAGLLLFSPSATRVDLVKQGWKTFFRGLADDDAQGKAVVPMFQAAGCKKIAVVNDKSAYGQGLAQVVVPAAKSAGVSVVLDEGIEPTTDYTSLVDSVLAKNPDGLFYAGYASEFQLVVKQLKEKGYDGLIASGDGSKSGTIGTDIGVPASDGVVLLCPCGDPNVSKDPKAQQFAADYKKAYNVAPDIYSAEGYDVANVTIEAIRECGKAGAAGITRQCVVDKVRGSNYPGLTKTFVFEPDGQVKNQTVEVYLIKDGKLGEVGPIDKLKKA